MQSPPPSVAVFALLALSSAENSPPRVLLTDRAMEKVFQNGFTQDPPAKALDFDAFLSPAHAFTKHGNVHGKLRWVFGVLAEQQKELSFAQFLTMAEALV